MKSRAKAKPEEQKPAGAFLSDGTYSEVAEIRHRGHIHGLVAALVEQRRAGALSVTLAVQAVVAANAMLAFPSYRQWETVDHWALCQTVTAAEAAVKYEGRAATGHWCGQRFAEGPSHDCPEIRHRQAFPCPPELRGQIDALERHFVPLELGTTEVEAPPPMR